MSNFYKYSVIAKEGDKGIQGFRGARASINDTGTVAFIGDFEYNQYNDASAVFVGNGSSLKKISGLLPFGPYLQINNAGQVSATEKYAGIRFFDSNNSSQLKLIAEDFYAGRYFGSMHEVSINNFGKSVFVAADTSLSHYSYETLLVTASEHPSSSFNILSSLPSIVNVPTLRPMIADTDEVVVKYGNQANSPILLFDNDLKVIDTIASSSDFTGLGQSPGISDDGKVVAFYGEDINGSGIFAWSDGETKRIAGISSGNGILDPGETYQDKNGNGKFDSGEIDVGLFKSFDPNSRVGVSFDLKFPDRGVGTVTYIATDTNDKEGLYTSSFKLTDISSSKPEFEVFAPNAVAKVGDEISGLEIEGLNIYDPINKSGEVAFWAKTDSGEAVIKASSPPTITVENASGTVQDGTLTFKVRLAQPLDRDLVLDYFTIDGSANSTGINNSTGIKDNQDFEAIETQNPRKLTIKKGDTEAEIKINIDFDEDTVRDQEFEFFARDTAYADWSNKTRADVDYDVVVNIPRKVEEVKRNQDITDTGYRVDKYFDDLSTDFQAVGLTATENFYLVLSDSSNNIKSPSKTDFLQQVSNDIGGHTNSKIYTNADNEIQQLNNSGKTWTFATGTIYDEDKPPVLAVRGTAGILDIFDDTNPNGVGYDQFTNNFYAVSYWLKQVSQPEKDKNNNPLFNLKPHITGHSLGGALSQWIAGEYLANTNSSFALGDIVAFNTPAISDAGAKKIDTNRVDSVEINIMSSDVVSLAGNEYPADSNNVTVNLFDYDLKKGRIFDFSNGNRGIFETHSVPMYLNKSGNYQTPSPSDNFSITSLTSSQASDFYFTHLPDPDYFAFLTASGKITTNNQFLSGFAQALIPNIKKFAPALVFRGTTEIVRKELGNGIRQVLEAIQNNQPAIQAGKNALNSSQFWNTTAWNTAINQAKELLNIIQPSTHTDLLNSSISGDLDTALLQTQNKLTQFANSTTFENDLTIAFGSELDTQDVNNLKQQWLAGDFSNLPPIEVVPSAKIGGYSGAFTALGEIYIGDDFLNNNTNNIDAVVDVLLEEIGHWVDNQVNEFDTPGDEGRIFASLAQGISLTPEKLENLRNENDFVALSLEQPDSVDENVIDNFWEAINFFTEEAWEALAEYPDEAWIAMRNWGETGWTAVSQWTPDEWNASKQLTSAQWEATEEFTENDWNNILQTPTNTPPQPINDSTTTNEDTAIEIDVLSNDTDAENNPLTLSINQAPTNGTTTVNDNGTSDPSDDTITYTPNSNFNGTDSFTYNVSDGTDTTSATVDITVNPINDIPVATNDTVETNEDQPLTILPSDLLSNDSDVDGDDLTITGVSNSANGTVELDANGNVLFTPDSNFNGLASFEYTVSDGSETAQANVEVTVNPVNDDNIINGTTGRDSLLGTDSNDIITGFQGADRITTGNGQDKIVYNSIVDAGDLITDFDPLNDILDLQGVLQNIGFNGSNAIDEGYIQLVDYGSRGTSLQIDTDGADGSAIVRPYLFLQNVSVAEINDNPNSLMFG